MSDTPIERLLIPKEVSEILRLKKSKTYQLLADGTIPCVVGDYGHRRRSFRVKPSVLERWMKARRCGMIDHTALPTWESIYSHAGLKPLKRGRGSCPFCDSRTGFSCNDEKGFNCFACNAHGAQNFFSAKALQLGFQGCIAIYRNRSW